MRDDLRIQCTMTKAINFAMQQNYVPVVRRIIVTNAGDEVLEGVELNITFEPSFAKTFTYTIGNLTPGRSIEISPVSITLITSYLFALTEKIAGSVTISLKSGDILYCEQTESIELLAYDTWSGLMLMPEILAAFVTPNHPALVRVLNQAAEVLKNWTGGTAFTGYQTQNPNNVKLQMGAIYTALQAEQIRYNNPPASYEEIGQRIRLPHVVLEQKQGTCLDLALLYAACLEAVGLHAMVVFKKGHAFGGCWVEEETFADCMVDDASAIEKRIVEGAEELLLIECTDFVQAKPIDFDQALKHGKDHMNLPSTFECTIDIKRARGSGIRPMPLMLDQAYQANDEINRPLKIDPLDTMAPTVLDNSLLSRVVMASGTTLTKQKVWERKLLDFSLRNTLLNFRVTKNALQLMTANLDELENHLSDGIDFRLLEVPAEWSVTLRDAKMFEIETDKDLVKTIASNEFESGRIRTFINEESLDKTLKNLYRSAKVSMEENGTNTLFLALGFLRWYESDVSEKARYAPLVLVPVDIVRNLRNKGYVLRSRQEEIQINITLLEYLKQDHSIVISGLDPLPEDDHGIDLPLIFSTIRQGIMGKKRWNIEEMAFVGLFSFGQFVMWNDIRNRSETLAENKVVSSLIEGKMNWVPASDGITAEQLDATVNIHEMAIPLSADSSQMVAISAAASGQSFVLHGPPGTGKSQTITNMISNALYQGKSVLFVAEKMAALNVVQKRLSDIGLGPFCLELHSNKTNKSAVLSALDRALEVGRIQAPSTYADTAKEIHTLRHKLNAVVEALHELRRYGKTLYEAIQIFEVNQAERSIICFDTSKVQALTAETIVAWDALVRRFGVAIGDMGIYRNHPLLGYKGRHYDLEIKAKLTQDLATVNAQCVPAMSALDTLIKWFDYSGALTVTAVRAMLKIARLELEDGQTLVSYIGQADFEGQMETIKTLVETGKAYEVVNQGLSQRFDIAVFEYPCEASKAEWQRASQTWFLPKFFAQNKLLKAIRGYSKVPSQVTKVDIEGIYEQLIKRKTALEALKAVPEVLTTKLMGIYREASTVWQQLERSMVKSTNIEVVYKQLAEIGALNITKALTQPLPKAKLEQCCLDLDAYLKAFDDLCEHYEITKVEEGEHDSWLEMSHNRLRGYAGHLDRLREVVLYNQAEVALEEAGLIQIPRAYHMGRITASNLTAAYQCGLYYALTLSTLKEDERLHMFDGKQFDDLIEQYREAIATYQQLTVQELVARLSANVPASGASSAASSEMGILKKAIKNNGRMLSLRRLFDQIPLLLRKLSPCMLMSPISVAQYIDPSFPKFDLVIFDEASQLPTSEAVGTIARGENVVIVGDPKQLPPTNFFASNRVDEENPEHEDLESLLDDCLAISMPQESLKWHYRSRHESLIAYSNMKYYDNKLYTFPSPRDLVSEVKWMPVEGYYDKGKTKQNKAEAEAIVTEIIRRLQDDSLRYDSIGVVTFSSVQQNLIDDLLLEAFQKYPELEDFDRNANEPIFIKNLENVQGDERDVILFSIGYGPDEQGQVSMNFGPLNRDGGWRRLNVAISRARKKMMIYAVLRPDQIDLSRTRSEGVAGLKGFLEFAQRGQNTLAQRADLTIKPEAALIRVIADAIEELGYEVKCNIGCSAFKMDIGIVNPKNTETYILGILMDGENCKEAATARDRFVLQPSVLKGLGWRMLRVWTLDWLDDSERVLKGIKAALETAIEASASLEPIEVITPKPAFAQLIYEQKIQETHTASEATRYKAAEIPIQGGADTFYLPENIRRIGDIAQKIIQTESPISRRILMKKVLGAWEITRSGARVESIFATAVSKIDKHITMDDDRAFFWRSDMPPAQYEIYRVEDETGNKRSIEDIASVELLNGIKAVLNEQVSLSELDLIRETAKRFGYNRLGSSIEVAVTFAINAGLEAEHLTKLENGNIAMKA